MGWAWGSELGMAGHSGIVGWAAGWDGWGRAVIVGWDG